MGTVTRMEPPRTHTIDELQAILSQQIDKIANDETTPSKVNAVVNATAAILRTAKMQMDYHKQIGKTPTIPLLMTGNENDKENDK